MAVATAEAIDSLLRKRGKQTSPTAYTPVFKPTCANAKKTIGLRNDYVYWYGVDNTSTQEIEQYLAFMNLLKNSKNYARAVSEKAGRCFTIPRLM